MSELCFSSALLNDSERYSKELRLPDYLYSEDGHLDRQRTIDVLLDCEYGRISDENIELTASVVKVRTESVYAGKCKQHILVDFELRKQDRRSCFPVDIFIPNTDKDYPLIVALDFPIDVNKCYCPIEELMDMGVAVARVLYTDITSDDGDFDNGIAPLLTDRSKPMSAGKLMIWAYAAGLIGKYMLEKGYASSDKLYVSGHSRLGKSALLAAALYTEFCGVHSNNSGCSGVAISREKRGETISKICKQFPYWFAPSYLKYADNEQSMPFDQHYLTALISPRKLSICAAVQDTWADTEAQFLSAEAASVIYERDGVVGLSKTREIPTVGYSNARGNIGFMLRGGTHYFSRDDWKFFIGFIKSQKE